MLARPRDFFSVVQVLLTLVICAMMVFVALLLASSQSIVAARQALADKTHIVERPTVNASAPLAREVHSKINGRLLVRTVMVASDRQADVHPPGVVRAPLPGEAMVSPAFLRAAKSDVDLRLMLRGASVVSVIRPAGLASPHELRMIQGITRAEAGESVLFGVKRFGGAADSVAPIDGPLSFVVPSVLILTFGPLLLALQIAVRLRAEEDATRFMLLRALGLTGAQCWVVAVGARLPALSLGSLAGWLPYHLWWIHQTRVPGTDFAFWSTNTRVDLWTQIAIVAGVVVVASALSGLLATKSRPSGPRPVPRTREWGAWTLLPVVVGLCSAAGGALLIDPREGPSVQMATAGGVAALVGSPLLMVWVVRNLSQYCAGRARSGWSLLGARWGGDHRSGVNRLAMGVSFLLLAVGVALPSAAALRADPGDAEEGLAAARGYNVLIHYANLDRAALEGLPGARSALPITLGTDSEGRQVQILWATCEEIQALVTRVVAGCETARPQWIDGGTGTDARLYNPAAIPVSFAGHSDKSLWPKSVVKVPIGQDFDGSVRYTAPNGAPGAPSSAYGWVVNVRDAGVGRRSFESALVGMAPAAVVENEFAVLIEQSHMNSGQLQFLILGLLIGALGLTLALLSALIRGVRDRAVQGRSLRRFGVSNSDWMRAQSAATALPLFTVGALTATITVSYWQAWGQIYPQGEPSWVIYLVAIASPMAIAGALTIISALLVHRSR